MDQTESGMLFLMKKAMLSRLLFLKSTRKGVKEQQMMWMAIKALQEAMDRIETLDT